jgi:hypothetical protein
MVLGKTGRHWYRRAMVGGHFDFCFFAGPFFYGDDRKATGRLVDR